MRGAIPPLSQYAFMALYSVKKYKDNLPLPLPFRSIISILLSVFITVLLLDEVYKL
jgi:hypothetical protein